MRPAPAKEYVTKTCPFSDRPALRQHRLVYEMHDEPQYWGDDEALDVDEDDWRYYLESAAYMCPSWFKAFPGHNVRCF